MLLWVLRLCLRGRYCTLWQFWWCYFLSQIYCYVFPSCFRMTDFQYRKHLDHHRHCCYVAMGTSTCACIFIFDKSWSYEKSTGYDSLANSNMNEAAKFIRVKDFTPIALLLCLSWCCIVIKSYKSHFAAFHCSKEPTHYLLLLLLISLQFVLCHEWKGPPLRPRSWSGQVCCCGFAAMAIIGW